MDGRGAWRDNVFVERLWRSVKYEEVYLRAYDPVLFTNAGENRRQFPNFPLLPTEELDYLRRHMRHPLGETPPTQSFDWLF